KLQAEHAEKKAAELSTALAANVERLNSGLEMEKKLKTAIEENLKTEARLKNEAVTQAARANQLARKAIAAAQRERAALRRAEQAFAAAQEARTAAEKSADEAYEHAEEARRAKVKAVAAQTANRTFREGLTLARTNIPKAAEAKYKEAAGLYTSLPEPDPDGEASTFMELADLYLKSENPKEVKDGMDLLEKAEKLFEEMNDDNGVAAVAIKTGDFFVSDLVLEGASDKDLTTHRYVSSLMYRNAFDSYKKAKNLAGLAAMSDKITYFLRLSDDPDDLRALISKYEELLPYYAERDF